MSNEKYSQLSVCHKTNTNIMSDLAMNDNNSFLSLDDTLTSTGRILQLVNVFLFCCSSAKIEDTNFSQGIPLLEIFKS